jgi:hypothetical protein
MYLAYPPKRRMVHRMQRRARSRTRTPYATLCLVVLLAATHAACTSPGTSSDDEGFENFKEAAASDRNYDMYWLGRSFQAGGLVFEGPEVDGIAGIGDVEGGGLSMSYTAATGTCCGSLRMVLYSPSAWEHILRLRARTRPPLADVGVVVVGRRIAELRSTFGPPGQLHGQILTVDTGSTVVEVITSRVEPLAAGDPQPNPLLDRETFLAVMENLRAYPD